MSQAKLLELKQNFSLSNFDPVFTSLGFQDCYLGYKSIKIHLGILFTTDHLLWEWKPLIQESKVLFILLEFYLVACSSLVLEFEKVQQIISFFPDQSINWLKGRGKSQERCSQIISLPGEVVEGIAWVWQPISLLKHPLWMKPTSPGTDSTGNAQSQLFPPSRFLLQ